MNDQTRRKHYNLIMAWAGGAEIQHKALSDPNAWVDCKHPRFDPEVDYRVKPLPRPPVYINFTTNDGVRCATYNTSELAAYMQQLLGGMRLDSMTTVKYIPDPEWVER